MSNPPSRDATAGESSTPRPAQHTGMKKLRKKKRVNNPNRALDEHDDVLDDDLVAGPFKRQRVASDGESSEGDDNHEDDDDEGEEVDDPGPLSLEGKDAELDKLEKRSTRRKKQAYYLREMCDKEQGKRYDAFVVTSIPKAAVSKLNRDLFDQQVRDDFASIIGGLGKIFVAEVIEIAKDIQEERGEKGPLTPNHLRLAKARMEDTGLKSKKGMFRR